MNTFRDELVRLANAGERAYESATDTREDFVDTFVGGVQNVRRRRVGGVVAGAAVVVAGLIAILAPRVGQDEPVPPASPGTQLWTHELGTEVWSAPALSDGLLVVAGLDGVVRAFDESTGDPRWEAMVGGQLRGGIAAVSDAAGTALLLVSDDGDLVRLAADGLETWRVQAGTAVASRDAYDQYAPTPAVSGQLVIVPGRDGTVRAFELATGEVAWSASVGAPVSASVAVSGDAAYVADRAGIVRALAIEDGSERWRTAIGDEILSSPGVAGGVLVTGSRGTAIIGLDLGSGAELWRVSLGSSWAESSVATDGTVAFAGSSSLGKVVAIDGATGDVQWRAHVGGWPWARPTVAGSEVFAVTAWLENQAEPPGSLWALDAVTGIPEWTALVGGQSAWVPDGRAAGAMASPAVGADVVAVAALDGTVAVFAR